MSKSRKIDLYLPTDIEIRLRLLAVQKGMTVSKVAAEIFGIVLPFYHFEEISAPAEATKPGTQGRSPKAVKAAMDWLSAYLAEGPVYCKKAIEKGIEAGHKRAVLFKAVAELGVITGGTKGERFYRLPAWWNDDLSHVLDDEEDLEA